MSDKPVINCFDPHVGQGRDDVYPISVHCSPAGETTDLIQVLIAHGEDIADFFVLNPRTVLVASTTSRCRPTLLQATRQCLSWC